jgi:hypothetical protein
MKQLSFIIATFGIVIVAHAQTKADEDAVWAIPRSICDAWAKHDAHEMGKFTALRKLMTSNYRSGYRKTSQGLETERTLTS